MRVFRFVPTEWHATTKRGRVYGKTLVSLRLLSQIRVPSQAPRLAPRTKVDHLSISLGSCFPPARPPTLLPAPLFFAARRRPTPEKNTQPPPSQGKFEAPFLPFPWVLFSALFVFPRTASRKILRPIFGNLYRRGVSTFSFWLVFAPFRWTRCYAPI